MMDLNYIDALSPRSTYSLTQFIVVPSDLFIVLLLQQVRFRYGTSLGKRNCSQVFKK